MRTTITAENNYILDRLFSAMSVEERQSFSDEQISILRRESAKLQPRTHTIDLRFSIPSLTGQGFYCVILAGSERRSITRIRYERKRFWRLVMFSLVGLTLLIGLSLGIPLALNRINTLTQKQAHPTALPWISTEAKCKGANRVWDNNACWDQEHDPTF